MPLTNAERQRRYINRLKEETITIEHGLKYTLTNTITKTAGLRWRVNIRKGGSFYTSNLDEALEFIRQHIAHIGNMQQSP